MKKAMITVVSVYEIEIDEQNEEVQAYGNEMDLIEELSDFNFGYHRLLYKEAVKVKDSYTESIMMEEYE